MREDKTLLSSCAKYPQAYYYSPVLLLLLTSRFNTFGHPGQHADVNKMCSRGQICLNLRWLLPAVWACVATLFPEQQSFF